MMEKVRRQKKKKRKKKRINQVNPPIKSKVLDVSFRIF